MLTTTEIEGMRRRAIQSQNRRPKGQQVTRWMTQTYVGGPLDGLRLRVPETKLGPDASVGFACKTDRGPVMVLYRPDGDVVRFDTMERIGA